MRLFLFVIAVFSFLTAISSPNTTDTTTNPVIFAETFFGRSSGKAGGLTLGLNVNYQVKKILLTSRFTGTTRVQVGFLSPFLPIPYFEPKSDMEEFAILFGRRITKERHSFSFSLGISRNEFTEISKDANNQFIKNRHRFWGLPFEANVKLFKGEKKRYKIYGLIPTGQRPVAFGRSIGLKLLANFSENTIAGMGITYGLGTHKTY